MERWDTASNQKHALANTAQHFKKVQEPKETKKPKYPLVRLEEICLINPNVDFSELITKDKEVSFVPMQAVSSNGTDFYPTNRKAVEYKGFTKFKDNDLLWAKITPCMENKKSLVVKGLKNAYGFGSTEFFVVRSKDKFETNIDFILQFLRLDSTVLNAKLRFKGSAGQQRVPKDFLQNLQIPLPPLKEQEKIVEFIEAKKAIIEQNNAKIKELKNLIDTKLQHLIFA
ncbi:restriction endonuclease subunit S [Campylobacter sp. MIT 99-7217]|uniref:restriction endonuclease subunit S n=1 Tax=Campylobacter sp. MIT 99-7217 TaxID=535091 RepID=UPI00163C5198|nr:restriction endonuclease subunit S [Campylobacter sp. MIT 99-7217]